MRRSSANRPALEASELVAKAELDKAQRLPGARSFTAVCLLVVAATFLITRAIGLWVNSRRSEWRSTASVRWARGPNWGD